MNREFAPHKFKNQFVLTSSQKDFPDWDRKEFGSWILFTSGLPVINVYDHNDQFLGWCVGYPIISGILMPEKVVIDMTIAEPFENFYFNISGRWTMLLISTGISRVYVDSYGSLSTVFSETEKTIASTPTLIGKEEDWDKELMKELGFPEVINWLPFGLTFKRNVKRLVPNHYLDLQNWKSVRHWPTPETDFTIEQNSKKLVERIANNVQSTIKAVSKKHKISFSLTAGRDSRMVLACARDVLENCHFFTLKQNETSPDTIISKLLATRFHLQHTFITLKKATPDELAEWLSVTGYSISGNIWKIHKTLESFDPERVVLPGMAGEVGRSVYWKYHDSNAIKISAEEVLKRIKMPMHEMLIAGANEWMTELSFLSTFTFLDLLYIEQRLGCWAAPTHYGNRTSVSEIIPLNSRAIFYDMARLPFCYRFKQKFVNDLINYAWPKLLQLPFNRTFEIVPGKKRLKKLLQNVLFLHQYTSLRQKIGL